MLELPNQWKLNEEFNNEYIFDSSKIYFCGLQATDGEKIIFASSTAENTDLAKKLAGYELLERIAILEEGVLAKEAGTYKQSISNGVAAYTNKEQAILNSMYESVERDLLLKSWNGQIAPNKIQNIKDAFILSHETKYSFESFELKYNQSSEFIAVVYVGWPKKLTDPLIYGFGCTKKLNTAHEKALKEMKQRFLFLKDEFVSENEPEFSASPFYHQDYYLTPKNHIKLKNWLDGKNINQSYGPAEELTEKDFTFKVIEENKNYVVVRAISEKAWPLYFGRYNYLPKQNSQEPAIHPIA